MSKYTQHYQPQRHTPMWPLWAVLAALVVLMLAVNSDQEDAKRTAEAKLSAALDDAYQAGVRDALGRCHK